MPTRIHELVKTYKLINDPNAPSWSVRFVGAIAGVALLVAGIGAIAWVSWAHASPSAPPNALSATTHPNADGTFTDYVGFDPAHFDPALGYDPAQVDGALAAWQTTHPNASVISKEPVWAGSHIIGYSVTYR